MRYIIMVFILTGCATTTLDQKREKVLSCTKDLINMDSGTVDSYRVCKDLFTRGNK